MQLRTVPGLGRIQVMAVIAAVGLVGASIPPAAAKIRCSEAYQLNKSGPVRTPYCEDEYVAEVARERGIRVSGAAIRASIFTKRDVCRIVRFDTRVASICGQVAPNNFRRRPIWEF
jgi:hypothetical protein